MPPERSKPRSSIDGIHRRSQISGRRTPEYRPDHELPAPPRQDLIREHEPEVTEPTVQSAAPEPVAAQHFQSAGSAEPRLSEREGTLQPMQPISETVSEADHQTTDKDSSAKPKNRKKLWLILVGVIIILAVIVIGAIYSYYQAELQPASNDTTKHVRVTIKSGETPAVIATQLQSAGVIRSSWAFALYTKLSHTENTLKAGTYSLQPSLSTQGIVDHLANGKVDTFDVTFLPGDTIDSNRQKLIDLGYSAADVDAALHESYTGPLFATKPAGSDLEGYFYGETNEFDTSASVADILTRFFGQYDDFITQNNITASFQKQGLTLYQGITLASIVQMEASNADDERQVARVFLNRMAAGMTLGSDVTAYYGAAKIGAAHSVSVDTPYNTRIHTGLPPGPIATPGNNALLAVANPADNNYLFFLSGDDGKMYYATTDAQHQQNIQQYCQKKCSVQ